MIPPHLFHYTSIETLKSILSNNNIRFKRLDLLNDPLESYSIELDSYRKNIFSSSWTSEESESIPMWKIYSDLKGVRLKFPIDLFSYQSKPYLIKTNLGYWFVASDLNKPYQVTRTGNYIKNPANDELLNITRKVYGPTRIEYIERAEDLTKDVITISNENHDNNQTINLNHLGLRKTLHWSFENEYRFRIVYPDVLSIKSPPALITLLLNNNHINEEYIDIEFNKDKIGIIEILLGPKVIKAEQNELEQFLNNLPIKYKILNSEIKIK